MSSGGLADPFVAISIEGFQRVHSRSILSNREILGNLQVELIQPVYGPTIYEAFIQKHGEGLQHFKERVSEDDIGGSRSMNVTDCSD